MERYIQSNKVPRCAHTKSLTLIESPAWFYHQFTSKSIKLAQINHFRVSVWLHPSYLNINAIYVTFWSLAYPVFFGGGLEPLLQATSTSSHRVGSKTWLCRPWSAAPREAFALGRPCGRRGSGAVEIGGLVSFGNAKRKKRWVPQSMAKNHTKYVWSKGWY